MKKQNFLRGIPAKLLPKNRGDKQSKFSIITSGPRNLETHPFDYRNPFKLKTLKDIQEIFLHDPDTRVMDWPITDDEPENFNYYCSDNVAIGLPETPECALVDIFGSVRTFTGAWSFALGKEKTRPNFRTRTLLKENLPIVVAETNHNNINYKVEYFATDIPNSPNCKYFLKPQTSHDSWQGFHWTGQLDPEGKNLFICVKCEISSKEPITNIIQNGFAQQFALGTGGFFENPPFAPEWKNIKLIKHSGSAYKLCASSKIGDIVLGLLKTDGSVKISQKDSIKHWPSQLRRVHEKRNAKLTFDIKNETTEKKKIAFEWIIPYFPLKKENIEHLNKYSVDQLKKRTIKKWEDRRKNILSINIPEEKVQNTFYQAINNLDICSVKIDETEFATPGPSGGYHNFYVRDSADMIYAYDILGESKRVEKMINHYSLYESCQESCSMLLWLAGKHFRLTKDKKWAKKIMPEVKKRMNWIISTWLNSKDNNNGLLPETELPDNECVKGHFVSYHLYTLAGIKSACELAIAAKDENISQNWQQFYEQFKQAVFRNLEELTQKSDGIITPSFEGFEAPSLLEANCSYGPRGGIDWLNVAAVFPTEVLPPDHTWIDSSLKRWRHAYLEGTFVYANGSYDKIHNYNTLNLSETWLRRGDYAETLRDLYGVLLHTSSCHGSAEVVPTTERHDMDCVPHNWFSGKYARFIRDCLVYEGHDSMLHILGCVSPAWMKPGMTIAIKNAKTDFGPINFSAKMVNNGMNINLNFKPHSKNQVAKLHLPPFLKNVCVEANNKTIKSQKDGWIIPAHCKNITVQWQSTTLPDISFEKVVGAYIKEYHKKM